MAWGAAIASAYEAASEAAKAAARTAVQTAQTAWDYTKQKAVDVQHAVTEGAKQTASAASAAADDAGQWAGEVADKAAVHARQKSAVVKAAVKEQAEAVGQSFENIKNSFKPQPAGSPRSTCPLQNSPALPPPGRGDGTCKPPPPCVVEPLLVRCGHGKRAFVLQPPNTPTNDAHVQMIQVIADNAGHDEIEVMFSAGACPHGDSHRPCLRFADQHSKSTLKLHLPAPPTLIQGNNPGIAALPFAEFIRHFVLRTDPDYSSFSGFIDCCSGQGSDQSFQVQVFPQREWSGKIQAGIEIEATNPLDANYARRKVYAMKRAELVIKGELTGKYGYREFKCTSPSFKIGGSTAKNHVPLAGDGFAVTKRWLDKIYPAVAKFKESDWVKIEPEWPNLSFGGSAKAVEVRGRYDVAWQGEAALKLEPLIGLKGTFDALQWLIDFACQAYLPPGISGLVSKQILKIRRMAERGVGEGAVGTKAVARVDISARGAFGGELKWELRPGLHDVASGSVLGDVDVTVEGKVSGELRVLRVSYQAGASIAGASGVSGKLTAAFYNGDLAFGGVAKLKEFKIKALAFQSIGGSSIGEDKEGKGAVADREAAKKKGKGGKWFGLFEQDNDSARAEDSGTWEMEIWPEAILLGGGLEKELYGDEFKGGGGSFGGGGMSGGHGATGSFTTLADGV